MGIVKFDTSSTNSESGSSAGLWLGLLLVAGIAAYFIYENSKEQEPKKA